MVLLDATSVGLGVLAEGWMPVISAAGAAVLLLTTLWLALTRKRDLSHELQEARSASRALESERDAARSEALSLRLENEGNQQAQKQKPAPSEGVSLREKQLQQELILMSDRLKTATTELQAAKAASNDTSEVAALKANLDQLQHDKSQLSTELQTEKDRSLALRNERDMLAARVAAAAQEVPLDLPRATGSDDPTVELQQYQQLLVQQGKMATLGQLIAGIIHEINTPLGAINAAQGSFQKTIPHVLHDYPSVLNGLTDELKALFFSLLDKSLEPHEALSSKEERSAKRALTDALETAKIPNASSIAANLVKSGISDGIEKYLELFQHPNTDQIFEMLSTATKIKMNMDNTEVAMAKMTRMVTGLKNFSHPATGDLEPTNLKENITTVLTVYHNKLKYGVEVSTHFDPDLELIQAYPDELTQVWTNLIHNAVDAMEGKGTLDVSVDRRNGHVVTTITDNGPGISADVKERIFQPFFTTKPKGQGTGLGLDIVRRIVEKHKGSIEVTSQPGETRFVVSLPEKQS
jgi:signal transduction histidine kinase